MNNNFTKSLDFIGKNVQVKMDRPLGYINEKFGWSYPVNYGYIPNTISPDGEELDAYVLGVNEPLDTFEGVCIAVIRRTDDDDDKLIVVPENIKDTILNEEIEEQVHFQEQWFQHTLIRGKNIQL